MKPSPKKSLGQHFLIADGIKRKIINLCPAATEVGILEIGPGPGALTQLLEDLPRREMTLVEKDKYWACEQKRLHPSANVLCQDALAFPWAALSGPWVILGNLPYNVASPLIWDIVSQCPTWVKLIFMVQKEVAQRICAPPGGHSYGALSVWVQSHALPHYEFSVSPGCFNPPPRVDSAVISLEPLRAAANFSDEALKTVLDLCFQGRRKQLGGLLRKGRYPELSAALAPLGIDSHARAEDLTPEQFQRLSSFLAGQDAC